MVRVVALAAVLLGASGVSARGSGTLAIRKVGEYVPDVFDAQLEILAYDEVTGLVFATTGEGESGAPAGISIFEFDGNDMSKLDFFETAQFCSGDPTSVAAKNGALAIACPAATTSEDGKVLILKDTARWARRGFPAWMISTADAGSLPDMVTFSPNGQVILAANEGEPDDETPRLADPAGSITIVKAKNSGWSKYTTCQARFNSFNGNERMLQRSGTRVGIFRGSSVAKEVEPEYIAVSDDSNWAFVTLQENNAIAKVDIRKCEVTDIFGMGYKDWSGLKLDVSDEDGPVDAEGELTGIMKLVNPAARYDTKLLGMYMPDSIVYATLKGKGYVITANEGDAREYEAASAEYIDEARGEDFLTGTMATPTRLGRLQVCAPDIFPMPATFTDTVYPFGARSFSIWGTDGKLVFDSGDFIETYIAENYPEWHNSEGINADGSIESYDARSDAKGPEPEGLVVFNMGSKTFLGVGLERVGGWMMFDITNPRKVYFHDYVNTAGDRGPESAVFIPGKHPLIVSAFEETGTLAVYKIGRGSGRPIRVR